MGLVEVERQPPRHCGLACAFEAVELSLGDVGARVQSPRELLLFLLKARDHHRLPLDELGIDVAHLLGHGRNQSVQEGAVKTQLPP